MASINKVPVLLNRFLDVPSTDPDDARRRKLLNIILGFVGSLTIFVLLVVPVLSAIRNISFSEVSSIYLTAGTLLIGTALLVYLNRTVPGWIASTLFLLFLMTCHLYHFFISSLISFW